MNLILHDLTASDAALAGDHLRKEAQRLVATANDPAYYGDHTDRKQLAEDGQKLSYLADRFQAYAGKHGR
jgi:hypothetical protein